MHGDRHACFVTARSTCSLILQLHFNKIQQIIDLNAELSNIVVLVSFRIHDMSLLFVSNNKRVIINQNFYNGNPAGLRHPRHHGNRRCKQSHANASKMREKPACSLACTRQQARQSANAMSVLERPLRAAV